MCALGAAFVGSAPCQITVPPGFKAEVFASGSPLHDLCGIAVADDALYVGVAGNATTPGSVIKINRSSGNTAVLLNVRPPVSDPCKILLGDGRPETGTDLVISDQNVDLDTGAACCNGAVFRVDRTTGAWSVILKANPVNLSATGDPWGLALGPGGVITIFG